MVEDSVKKVTLTGCFFIIIWYFDVRLKNKYPQFKNYQMKTRIFLFFLIVLVLSEIISPGCKQKPVVPTGKIVLIKSKFIGVDFDGNEIPDKQIEVDAKTFMRITSGNLEYDMPVTLSSDSTCIVSLNFPTHTPLILAPDVVRRHMDTFMWKRQLKI